jgi:hypothetical protein
VAEAIDYLKNYEPATPSSDLSFETARHTPAEVE